MPEWQILAFNKKAFHLLQYMSKYQAVLLQSCCSGSVSAVTAALNITITTDFHLSVFWTNTVPLATHIKNFVSICEVTQLPATANFLFYCYYFNCFNFLCQVSPCTCWWRLWHYNAYLDSKQGSTVIPKALRMELFTLHSTARASVCTCCWSFLLKLAGLATAAAKWQYHVGMVRGSQLWCPVPAYQYKVPAPRAPSLRKAIGSGLQVSSGLKNKSFSNG